MKSRMKKCIFRDALRLSLLVAPFIGMTVDAHSRWVVPSHTILSGDKPEFVSVDFSISNDIFHPDMPYGGDDYAGISEQPVPNDKKARKRLALMKKQFSSTKVVVTEPGGKAKSLPKFANLGRKSSAAFLASESGTYKISIEQNPMMITLFKNSKGEKAREFGSYDEVKSLLPEGIKQHKTLRVNSRIETYVTRNELSRKVLAAQGSGLEVVFKGHPNELFAGESSDFQLLFNGTPVASATEVKITRSGTRHRNLRDSMVLETDQKGNFSVNWKQGGFYLLEVELTIPSKDKGIDFDAYSYYLTLEVNPE